MKSWQELHNLVKQGLTVHRKNDGYIVEHCENLGFTIRFKGNDSMVGLYYPDYSVGDFYLSKGVS